MGEISEFQEFQFQKIVEESVELYDLESEEMDLFDGGLFGADSDTDSESEESSVAADLFAVFGDDDDPEMEVVYKKVTKIENAFCFGCGAHWEEGHVCDSTFKQDLCDILTMADTKTIGEQTDCRNCKKSFCFVCLKPRLDSGWQCGSYSSKCPDGVKEAQGMESLPDAIVLTKNAFHLY